tara:strand:+ start:394 stop:708 length:315 start_codon:yes stop_codon:yes gene_type:complete
LFIEDSITKNKNSKIKQQKKMTDITTDQCFDQMATTLGMGGENPSDVGYVSILEEVKKMKEKQDELIDMLSSLEDYCELIGTNELTVFHDITENKFKEGGEFSG